MRIFLIICDIICAILWGMAACANYNQAGAMTGTVVMNIVCCVCWIICTILNVICYKIEK